MSVSDITSNLGFEPLGTFAQGFLDSAAALFQRADRGEGLVDYAFYPGAYCLRHGLELLIKQMSIYAAFEMRDQTLLYSKGHDLQKAWTKTRGYLMHYIEATPAEPGEESLEHHFQVVDSVIEELHDLDPTGELFRYPELIIIAKNGQPRQRSDQRPPFDVVSLRDWASTAAAVLEAARNLLYFIHGRISDLAHQRGEPSIRFQDSVIKKENS